MIRKSLLRQTLALLLPLLVLQAMLPAGYMPAASDGELRIVMCSAGLTVTGDPHQGGQETARMPVVCLHAGAAAPPPSPPALRVAHAAIGDVEHAVSPVSIVHSLQRVQSARGPPAVL